MRTRRALSLRKETLTEIGPDRLSGVAAGAPVSLLACLPTRECFTQAYQTCGCCTATASCE